MDINVILIEAGKRPTIFKEKSFVWMQKAAWPLNNISSNSKDLFVLIVWLMCSGTKVELLEI